VRDSGRADEEGPIAASFGEPGAKVTADRTGADNEDSQPYGSKGHMIIQCGGTVIGGLVLSSVRNLIPQLVDIGCHAANRITRVADPHSRQGKRGYPFPKIGIGEL
jgi:hypothetical protein